MPTHTLYAYEWEHKIRGLVCEPGTGSSGWGYLCVSLTTRKLTQQTSVNSSDIYAELMHCV